MIELKNRGVVRTETIENSQTKVKSTKVVYEVKGKTVFIDKDSWTSKEWDLIAANKAFILFQDACRKKLQTSEEVLEYLRRPITKSCIQDIWGRPDTKVEDMSEAQQDALLEKLLALKAARTQG